MKYIITILQQEYSKFIKSAKNKNFVYGLLQALTKENIDILVEAIKKDELEKDGGNILNNLLTLQPFTLPIIEIFIANNYFTGDNDFLVRVDKTMQISSRILEQLQEQKRKIRKESTHENLRSSESQLLEIIDELNKQKKVLKIITEKKKQYNFLQEVKDKIDTIESSFDESDRLDLKSKIYKKLNKDFINLKKNYDNIKREKLQLKIDKEKLFSTFTKEVKAANEAKNDTEEKLKISKTENDKLENENNCLKLSLNKFKQNLKYAEEIKNIYEDEIEELNIDKNNIKKENDKLENENNSLRLSLNELNIIKNKIEKERKNYENKYNFITSILSAKKSDNEYLCEFQSLFYKEFLPFANKESSLSTEAEAVLIMQSIEKELKIIADCTHIYGKSIVAIGGGFSGGKTEFVSSFFKNNDIQLPIGINPVTAIPTYIINGPDSIIRGFSYNGGIVNLNIEQYRQLSHDFIKSLGFNLKNIMPMMAIETPIEYYNNICFIDTPGYNSAKTQDGFTFEDKKCALEYLEEANGLIWVIDIERGTIPQTDLNFLNELKLNDKKLYIVINKADLKDLNSSRNIITIIAEVLDDYDIDFEGISAYSSIERKEYNFINESIYDFLQKQNCIQNLRQSITYKLNIVIQMYINALKQNIKYNNRIKQDLDALNFDLMETGNHDIPYQFEEHLSNLKNNFNASVLQDQIEEISHIGKKIERAITNIFKNVS